MRGLISSRAKRAPASRSSSTLRNAARPARVEGPCAHRLLLRLCGGPVCAQRRRRARQARRAGRPPGGRRNPVYRAQVHGRGKSTARIGGRPVPLTALRELAAYLVVIHGQHLNQRILDPASHIGYLDGYLGADPAMAEYAAQYRLTQAARRAAAPAAAGKGKTGKAGHAPVQNRRADPRKSVGRRGGGAHRPARRRGGR